MNAICHRRTRLGNVAVRNAGMGALTLLLVLTACTPPAPQPSASSQPPSQSPSATGDGERVGVALSDRRC